MSASVLGQGECGQVLLQPEDLGLQRQRAMGKRAELRTIDGRQISKPVLALRLDKAGTADSQFTQATQVNLLAVQTMDLPRGVNQQLHGRLHCAVDSTG